MAGYFFGCPHCRAKLEARDTSRAGRTVVCPKCQQALLIPPPPPMGILLDPSDAESVPAALADPAPQIVVSSDPGFKRVLSPAKAYPDSHEAPPPLSSSEPQRLPPAESLLPAMSHVLEAGDEIEGYSFTAPEHGTDVQRTPAFVFKPKKKRTPEEAPHLLEDPKYQLAALVAVVLVLAGIGAIWSWLSSGDDKDKDQDTQSQVAPEVAPAPQPPPHQPAAPPGHPAGVPGLPGAAPNPMEPAQPDDPNPLPDTTEPVPASPPDPAIPPGAVLNVLPGADSPSKPGKTPRPLPESTPNVLPGTTP